MELTEIMDELKSLGTERTKKNYMSKGAKEPVFGLWNILWAILGLCSARSTNFWRVFTKITSRIMMEDTGHYWRKMY